MRALFIFTAAFMIWLYGAEARLQTPMQKAQVRDAALSPAAQRMDAKLQHIRQNGAKAKPDQTPTILTKPEIDAYLNSGRVKLPVGVKIVEFSSKAGVVTAHARVDFDEIASGRRSQNPLLYMFSGMHDVDVVAQAEGSGNTARVYIQSFTMDGITIPRRALKYYIDNFVKKKYPHVSLDNEFRMPARIDTAMVGENQLTITQK